MTTDNLKKKIAALRQKTTAQGCTEDEAMAAAMKAAELMREHGLTDDDLDMGSEDVVTRLSIKSDGPKLWSAIGRATNTAVLTFTSARVRTVTFTGRPVGTTVAVYLLEVCENAIQHETAKFRKGAFYRRRRTPATRAQAARDFGSGMITRLIPRLYKVFADTMDADEHRKALDARDRANPYSAPFTPKVTKSRFDNARWAGWDAGGKVTLARGVNEDNQPTKLIGSNA
ncbi:DUF2786 domain-containing protein [Rhizobium sp. CFBP 8762]|uniref:DUF7168 domain-containing protein n=1 Tax=Rhizobium sp. CFBP 8762 TaxID=2775279 RepID=UPI00177A7BBD|nr:DUF2786 domain-containing protein [Rhizobium sp. CFBP 8762]MBD8554894.1 DUF2786 domain-containing protein [Rhizobium sp. CFBP 8762]